MANWYEEKRFSPEDLFSIVFLSLLGYWQFPTKLFAQYIYFSTIKYSNVTTFSQIQLNIIRIWYARQTLKFSGTIGNR